MIAQSWTAHHRMFRLLAKWDSRLAALNMVFLLAVVLLPFSTRLLGNYLGEPALPVIAIYTGNLVLSSGMLTVLWWHIARGGLALKTVDAAAVRHLRRRSALVPLVLLLAIPWAFVDSSTAWIPWVLAAFAPRLLPRRTPDDRGTDTG